MNEESSLKNQIEQHSIGKSILLHLMPAIIWLGFYFPLARLASKKGIPTMLIMYILVALVLIPVEVGYLYYQGLKKNGKLSLKGVVLYREKMPWWQYLLFGFIIVGWLVSILFLLGSRLSELATTYLFSWIPDWFYLNKGSVEQNGLVIEIMMWILSFIFIALIGPLVEELYFRGYLLPRLSRLGKWAPFFNVVLFISYHFWQPHFLFTGIIAMLVFVYIVWWKRNVYLAIGVHCFINTFGWVVDFIQRLGSFGG